MRKSSYWLALAMFCGATMFGYTSCGSDDDDDVKKDNGNEQTTGAKPVYGTDFTATVDGNKVTIASNLNYSNQWVTFNGAQYNLSDGKITIDIPVEGEYSMTLSYFNNNAETKSDEFKVKIEATNMDFLDQSLYKVLSGGQDAYKAGTNDGHGVFTRTWRVDWFDNGEGDSYCKSAYGKGILFGNRTDQQNWNRGNYQGQAGPEQASISFDFVNGVAKLVVEKENSFFKQSPKAAEGEDQVKAYVDKGTYYTNFTIKEVEEDFSLFDGTMGTLEGKVYEISLAKTEIGSDAIVRLPLDDHMPNCCIDQSEMLNFRVFINEDENVFFAHYYRSDNADCGTKCDLIYTFVCDQLENEYQYEVPEHFTIEWEGDGDWESSIHFWGDRNYDQTEINYIKIKDGEYTYKTTFASAAKICYGCIHFNSNKTYDLFTGDENFKYEIKSVKLNGKDYAFEAEWDVQNGDSSGNYRLVFESNGDWTTYEGATEFAEGDVLEITVSYSNVPAVPAE